MSESWGYVCRSHDPELKSEPWWNHGDADLIELYNKVRAGDWPIVTADLANIGLAFEGEPYDVFRIPGGGVEPVVPVRGEHAPVGWLFQHPRCEVALLNEYGKYQEIP